MSLPSAKRCLALLLASSGVVVSRPDHFDIPADDRDLFKFVSRPDLTPPRFNITVRQPELAAPGYIFVAPYVDLQSRTPSTLFHAGQTGPHIYDQSGELVWSGAQIFRDRATFDFKVSTISDTDFLSFLVMESAGAELAAGAGVILDSSYRKHSRVVNRAGRGTINMHEFSLINNGQSALWITFSSQLTDISNDPGTENYKWIGNNGFTEVDVATGDVLFEWWALDYIHPSESRERPPPVPGAYQSPWDFFHANSVEKDSNGDYLLSARFTNTIYKISGKDGSIIWRLGGNLSDFKLSGFNFTYQHDARQLSANSTHTIVSLFDNASNGIRSISLYSSAMVVALNMEDMIATVVKQLDRPDSKLSELRGNMQTLPSGNSFVCWSENARISEFDPQGTLVYDAQFASHRFVTYRAFKFEFVGRPQYPPSLRSFVYGADRQTSTTVIYVSWNGATEVQSWNFYTGTQYTTAEEFALLGSSPRTGFETTYMVSGFHERIIVEAVASNGTVIARTLPEDSELPYTLTRPNQPSEDAQESPESPANFPDEHGDSTFKKPSSGANEGQHGTNNHDTHRPTQDDHSSTDDEVDSPSNHKPILHIPTAVEAQNSMNPILVMLGFCLIAVTVSYAVARCVRRRRFEEWKDLRKYDED